MKWCVNEELITQIDRLIEEDGSDLTKDIIKLVNIKSVEGAPVVGAPFGEGPRKVLDAVVEMGRKEGFFATDYQVGVISVALKEGQPDLGIWAHGDVVPEGDGWNFEPYNAMAYKGCIIGRGATDNKGQLAAIFHLIKIFKKLNIALKYNPALYVGSNEETGMKDIIGIPDNPDAKGFINVCTPPRMSLVPDEGFPVAYGGKGSVKITLKSKTALHGFTLTAGQNDSPGRATAVFDTLYFPDKLTDCTVTKGDKTVVSAQSMPVHGAHPASGGNMITKLTGALLDNNLVAEQDRYILDFLKRVSMDVHGAVLGLIPKCNRAGQLASEDTEIQNGNILTVSTSKIDFADGCPELLLDIRYPIAYAYEEIVDCISRAAEENGFQISNVNRGVNPYMLNPEAEMVKTLCAIANEVTGAEDAPFIMSGGTYAHRLPNALVYGMNGCLPPEDFPTGRGNAHGVDEAVSLERLQRGMKIYARALLALNDMEW